MPALLENQVKEKACSDSEDAGGSECADTDLEEQGDHACSKKPPTDLEVDKKVSQELRFPCSSTWQHSCSHFFLSVWIMVTESSVDQ